MALKARQYKNKDIKKLFALSGNQCAEPSCSRNMISEDGRNVLGEIAHICAASAEGPRFDSKMTDDERRLFDNLILLCDEHHKMIDNPDTIDQYSALLIKEWKENHLMNLEDYSVKFTDEMIQASSDELDKNSIHIQGEDNQVIQNVTGNVTITKIGRQINQGGSSTYNENN